MYNIYAVQLWNRGDNAGIFAGRLQNFNLYVGGTPPPAAGTQLSNVYPYNPACLSHVGTQGPLVTGIYPCVAVGRYLTFQSTSVSNSANLVALCNVAAYGGLATAFTNLVYSGLTATASSTYTGDPSPEPPSRAVNNPYLLAYGVCDPTYADGNFWQAEDAPTSLPWWTVDLGAYYSIFQARLAAPPSTLNRIERLTACKQRPPARAHASATTVDAAQVGVWNRGDGVPGRLQNFTISLGGGAPPASGTQLTSAYTFNPACYQYTAGLGPTISGLYPCVGAGRYVTVQSATLAANAINAGQNDYVTNLMALCNVAVYGSPVPLANLVTSGVTATASSFYVMANGIPNAASNAANNAYLAANAVCDPNGNDGSFWQADGDVEGSSLPWWTVRPPLPRQALARPRGRGSRPNSSFWRPQVDLGATYNIVEVQLWNRPDYGQGRLQSFNVYAGANPPPVAGTLLTSAYPYNPACYSFTGGLGPAVTGTYPCVATARYVTFQSMTLWSNAINAGQNAYATNYVALCNVAVYGYATPLASPPSAPASPPPPVAAACSRVTNAYAFEPGYYNATASTFADLGAGPALAATVHGAVALSTGGPLTNSGYLVFVDSSTYVQLPPASTVGAPLSVLVWVNVATTANPSSRLWDFSAGAANLDAFWVAAVCSGCSPTQGNLAWQLGLPYESTNISLPRNTWAHFAMTVDASSTVSLYLNGALQGTPVSSVSYPLRAVARNTMYLGKSQWDTDPPFAGGMASFQMALGSTFSAGDVANVYANIGCPSPPPPPSPSRPLRRSPPRRCRRAQGRHVSSPPWL